jgi:hypothetical protein
MIAKHMQRVGTYTYFLFILTIEPSHWEDSKMGYRNNHGQNRKAWDFVPSQSLSSEWESNLVVLKADNTTAFFVG